MKQKKLPIGRSDFKSIIEENFYYVDKSLFIKELIDNGSLVTVLPRPRRFGKTLNLNMLKCFFELKKDGEKNLFENLAIWQAGEEYRKKYGQFPVIYLTFKDVKQNEWEGCYNQIKRVMRELYDYHRDLLESPYLESEEKTEFTEILTSSASDTIYQNSLKFLSGLLWKHHGKLVVILIDEYDIPIQQGYTGGFYTKVVEFAKTFLSGGLKDNPHLEKAVLTGILRVSKESIFSDLNNPKVCTILSRQYADKFGLLESEVRELLDYYEIGFEMDHVRSWYNGYLCGETELYNPWSIINFADNWKDGLKSYWINSSSNTLIKQIITRGEEELKEDLKKLLTGTVITKVVNENIIFPEIESNPHYLFSFLLFSGYLKPLKIYQKERKTYCELAIPNEEVKMLYETIVESWFSETIRNDKMELMLKALTSGDVETFDEIFSYYLETSVSYFNLGSNDAERVYQAFILGLVIWLSNDYTITSEEPAGFGRADVMIIPHDKTKRGIIFEFKKAGKKRNKTLEEAAMAAKNQMIEKKYRRRMEAHGVSLITMIAIGFKGQECLVIEVE